ncbi:Sensory box histidine kinase/response regulator [Minicystis rosea]|nr:Sensory box histidine kinase/response regulator [Minicystis rosea]
MAFERKRLRSVMDLLPVGIFVAEQGGRIVEMNPAAMSIWETRHAAPSAEGYDVYQGFRPATGERLTAHEWALARVLVTGETIRDEELDILTSKGNRKTILNSAIPFRGPTGAIAGGIAVNVDITPLKRIERRLATQYEVIGILAESGSLYATGARVIAAVCAGFGWDLGVLWRVEGGALTLISLWSAADHGPFETVSRTLRLGPGEGMPGIVWKSGAPLWVTDLAEAHRYPRSAAAARDGLRGACTFPIRAGARICAVLELFSGAPRAPDEELLRMFDAIGVQLGQFIVREEAEAKSHEEQARKAAVLDAALDAIVTIDAAGRVTEWNPAAERAFGYPRENAIGRVMAELIIPPSLREAHRLGLAHYLASGEGPIVGKHIELEAMRADGSCFPIELTVTRLPTQGPPLFTGFVRDISDRRRAEDVQRRETAFRERFIGILGHDLRTPLTAITFTAGSLLRQEELDERATKGIRRIAKSADRMDRMIRDLLDFARSREGGGIPITPAPVDLGAACRHILDEVEITYPSRAVQLTAGPGSQGRWDPDRIGQVVQNLVTNALDYSPPDTPVHVDVDAAGPFVLLHVRNQGPVIPKESIGVLFDPFKRGAEGRAPHTSKGLGLGLYITHEIVRAHGGDITVTSEASSGTTFTVRLPRSPPPKP